MNLYAIDPATNLYNSATDEQIIAVAKAIATRKLTHADTQPLGSPKATREFLQIQLATQQREVFAAIFLDSRHRPIEYQELFFGTIDGASVHPREVVKAAMKVNAAAVIIAHNHPSGIAEPSQADEIITTRLRDALALVEVRLLDHFICAQGIEPVSLSEKGLI